MEDLETQGLQLGARGTDRFQRMMGKRVSEKSRHHKPVLQRLVFPSSNQR